MPQQESRGASRQQSKRPGVSDAQADIANMRTHLLRVHGVQHRHEPDNEQRSQGPLQPCRIWQRGQLPCERERQDPGNIVTHENGNECRTRCRQGAVPPALYCSTCSRDIMPSWPRRLTSASRSLKLLDVIVCAPMKNTAGPAVATMLIPVGSGRPVSFAAAAHVPFVSAHVLPISLPALSKLRDCDGR
jgi:hypothetical protein